jgi:putative ABC transport system ATP-binding protein
VLLTAGHIRYPAAMSAIVRIEDVHKEYRLGKVRVAALRGVSLEIPSGAFVCVAGPSGSGKTTLLNLIGCVDVPTAGRVVMAGEDIGRLSDRSLTGLRLHTLGFIFQSFNLIPVLTVFQNVEFPLLLQGKLSAAERAARVNLLLERVGLVSHARHRPAELSGGQRQRVAVARALATRPKIVLADEPTANLDSATGASILELMKEMNRQEGTTFVFSSHDHTVIGMSDAVFRMQDGRLASLVHPLPGAAVA